MNIGRESILRERQRQIEVEGFTLEHDDAHTGNELYLAAECYYCAAELGRLICGKEVPAEVIPCPEYWPFELNRWKPGRTSRRNYEKAGAMFLAEFERLDRAKDTTDAADQCRQHFMACATHINTGLSVFVKAFNQQAEDAYQNSKDKGFHDHDNLGDLENGNRFMLIVGEVAEAHDALRHGNPPDDHIPDFNGAEAELADVVIRCMDTAETNGWRLSEAVESKMLYNATRPHMHGKKF